MVAHGTIAFDTLTTSDQVNTGTEKSLDTSYIFNGVAKAWVRFNGTTFNTSGDNTFNVTSLTDDGTGDYTVTIANDFDTIQYAWFGSGNEYHVLNDGENTVTTMQVGNYDHNHSRADTTRCFATGFGELA